MAEKIIRGCYLHYCDVMDPGYQLTGVDRKVLSQIKAFNDLGVECRFRYCARPISFLKKAISCMPFASDGVDWPDAGELGELDFLYIRRPVYVSRDFLRFLKVFREQNPRAIVFYEIPTYPYDAEMKGFNHLALLKDRHNRIKMNGLVDRIVDLSGQEQIFAIPTIQIINGIDLDQVAVRAPNAEGTDLNLLFVAMFADWHAADRAIRGIDEYIRSGGVRNVVLHLVGGGDSISSLESLTHSLGLKDHVVFHGYCDADEMNGLYDACDMAIASLGLHRIGIEMASTLKTREYLAKGIPFVYSGKIDVCEDSPVDFSLEVPADDSS